MLCEGKSLKEIAYECNISIKTVERYVQQVYSKVGCSCRFYLLHWALKTGYIDFKTWIELPLKYKPR